MSGRRVSIGANAARLGAALVFAATASGCMTVKSYVDPKLPKVSYEQLRKSPAPQPVQLFLEFQTDGNANTAATEKLKPQIVKVLNDSKMFSQVHASGGNTPRKMFVTINNLVEKDAVKKGVGTGLTLGLAGSLVTDAYAMNASYQVGSNPPIKKSYQHALHSTIGNASGPPGLEPTNPEAGFTTVFEQLMLNFLKDLGDAGAL